jgi:transposase
MDESSRAAPVHIGVGIDTARYGHHVAFVGEDRQEAATDFTFMESREGYTELKEALDTIAQRHAGQVHFEVRIDAAGQYATNLHTYLHTLDVPMTISVGEPKRNKDYKNVHYPKRKADQVDSKACARFAVVERPAASAQVPCGMRELSEVANRLNAQRKQTTRFINQLHNLLARVFPELATMVSDVSAGWVLDLLAKYPSAKRIAQARTLNSIPYIGAERAHQIQSGARTTTASLGGVVGEGLVEQAIENIRHSQQAEHTLERLLEQAYDELGAGGHRQVSTIVGIGKRTAAALIAKIVSIDRFAAPQQLVNYFGCFPEENSSGVDKRGKPVPIGSMQMSRKGNDLVRGYLWMACQAGIRCNPALRGLYRRQRAMGKRGDVALGHCMRKMLHLVFAVWKTDRPFDPNHHRWEATHPVAEIAATPDACAAHPLAPTPPTNELATRLEPSPPHAGADQPTTQDAGVPTFGQPVPANSRTEETEQVESCNKKTAGRTGALHPESQAVTAATNELAPRTLPPADGTDNLCQPTGAGDALSPAKAAKWVEFAHLRHQITMERVLSQLGALHQLRGRGSQRRGACPIHGSQGMGGRPFSVHLGKNIFRCLNPACAKQGNVLDLWAALHHLPLREAAINLAETFQLELAPAASHGNRKG